MQIGAIVQAKYSRGNVRNCGYDVPLHRPVYQSVPEVADSHYHHPERTEVANQIREKVGPGSDDADNHTESNRNQPGNKNATHLFDPQGHYLVHKSETDY